MKNIRIRLSIKHTVLILAWCFLYGCKSEKPTALSFTLMMAGELLEFGKPYPAPNADGTFIINDFKLYISNIKLISGADEKDFEVLDSYHLLTFQDQPCYTILLSKVPSGPYQKIQMSIGVDEVGNFSKNYPGDLDPTNQMAWNWTQGYKFILFEGLYTPASSDEKIPLVYHVGFSENRKDLEFELSSSKEIPFTINVDQLFESPNLIDFHTHPRILFNKDHSAMISENYSHSFIQGL
jgi:hypothetical protein